MRYIFQERLDNGSDPVVIQDHFPSLMQGQEWAWRWFLYHRLKVYQIKPEAMYDRVEIRAAEKGGSIRVFSIEYVREG